MTKPVNSVGEDHLNHRTASQFRNWVRNLWIENCEERLVYSQDPVTMQQYWNTYKWWIKREYKHKKDQNVI